MLKLNICLGTGYIIVIIVHRKLWHLVSRIIHISDTLVETYISLTNTSV